MKVLIIYAHPEPRSLNGLLFKTAIDELTKQGHEVQTSDLYAMNWKSEIDSTDFPLYGTDETNPKSKPMIIAMQSMIGYTHGQLTEDVKKEQEKLAWSDTVIFLFPLWWSSWPAIMKGWVDRVFSMGYAYGVGFSAEKPHGERYGEGVFKGKRALLAFTAGGPKSYYGELGIGGELFNVLYPIQHNVLFYPGFDVLPPFVAFNAGMCEQEQVDGIVSDWKQYLGAVETAEPYRFRSQNGGDYDLKTLVLKEELVEKNVSILEIHLKK
ncbi:unnamed protein product [Ambrosiozyma monospora]|uniref:Unnamed protein product n=1 Tax=Ambrosiozyma monospora TaxID=43982 RepID=A0ACB5SR39_AMBMO|nr:unnamed protein product [Ambrosiozyma monospora]